MKKFSKQEVIIFLLILAIGIFLRLYHLDYPLGLHGDEAWTGIEAKRILQEGSIGVWSKNAYGQGTLGFYWTALIFKITGSSVLTLRLSYALLAIFSLPFFYFISRLLFSKTIALFSFFLFATARIPIHFAHMAYSPYLTAFLLTIFFFLLALKQNKTAYYLLAGIFLGLSPYFYPGLNILSILLLMFLLMKSFLQNHTSSSLLKERLPNILILFLTSLVILLPLFFYLKDSPEQISSRTNLVSIFNPTNLHHTKIAYYPNYSFFQIIFEQTKAALLMFNLKGDHDAQNNFDKLPVFDLLTGLFFLIGLLSQIRNITKPNILFLFMWFLFFLSGTIFTVDAPNFRRSQPSIAAAYIFAGLGMEFVYQWLNRNVVQQIALQKITVVLILGLISMININIYFNQQSQSFTTKNIFAYPLIEVGKYLNILPHDSYIYFYSAHWPYNYETLRFLNPGLLGEDRSSEFGVYSLKKSVTNQNLAYILLPPYTNNISDLEKLYPGGIKKEHQDEDGTLIFTSYFLPNMIN